MAKVIITIPLYNGEKYIYNTISSIINQTFDNWILILSDDNSNDSSLNLVEQFKDERISVLKNKFNKGMVGNWNNCLDIMKNSNMEYSLLICQDDILKSDYLEKKLNIMERNPDVVLVSNATQIVNSSHKKLFVRKNMREGKYYFQELYSKILNRGNIYGEPAVVLLRTEAIQELKGFDEKLKYTFDLDYFMRVSMKGKSYFMEDILSEFMVSGDSGTSKIIHHKQLLYLENERIAEQIYFSLDRKENFIFKINRRARYWLKYGIKKFVFKYMKS